MICSRPPVFLKKYARGQKRCLDGFFGPRGKDAIAIKCTMIPASMVISWDRCHERRLILIRCEKSPSAYLTWKNPALGVRPPSKSAANGWPSFRDFEQRTELLESAPDIYYLKDHYQNYPVVLVRLARISRDALEGLLRMAWQVTTTKKVNRR